MAEVGSNEFFEHELRDLLRQSARMLVGALTGQYGRAIEAQNAVAGMEAVAAVVTPADSLLVTAAREVAGCLRDVLDGGQVLSHKAGAALAKAEEVLDSKEAFLDLDGKRQRLEMAIAAGTDVDRTDARLAEIEKQMAASRWSMHPDYGCVLASEVPALEAAGGPCGVRPGDMYIGPIVEASTSYYAVQKAGRKLVFHEIASLDAVPAVGESVTIKYDAKGRGTVLQPERVAEKSVSR